MSEIALSHGIMLFLGNFAGTAIIANKQCVNKWNVGVGFEGDEERNLQMIKKIKKNCWQTVIKIMVA